MDKQRGFSTGTKAKRHIRKMNPILTLYDDKYAVVWVGADTYIENEKTKLTVNYTEVNTDNKIQENLTVNIK